MTNATLTSNNTAFKNYIYICLGKTSTQSCIDQVSEQMLNLTLIPLESNGGLLMSQPFLTISPPPISQSSDMLFVCPSIYTKRLSIDGWMDSLSSREQRKALSNLYRQDLDGKYYR
jgi:hypothetical protein